jgi:hypothetical protein
VSEPHAGRQQKFAADQQRGDVRHLAGVHPADRPLQLRVAGEHLRQSALQRGERERLRDGDGGRSVRGYGHQFDMMTRPSGHSVRRGRSRRDTLAIRRAEPAT